MAESCSVCGWTTVVYSSSVEGHEVVSTFWLLRTRHWDIRVQVSVVCASSCSWVCPQQWSVESSIPVGLPSGAAAPCWPSGVLLVVHHSGLLLAASLGFPFVDLFSGAPHSTPGVAQADSGTRVHICPIGFIYINPFTLKLQTASSPDVGIFMP